MLILDAKGELLFFRSPAHLQAYVEPIDVTNSEYGPCWDPEGRLFELRVETHDTLAFGLPSVPIEHVLALPVEEQPTHRWDLHQALLLYIADSGFRGTTPLPNDTTGLVQFALEHAGWR